MKKSNVIFLLLTVIVMVITVIGATFAWFSASVNVNNVTNINVGASNTGIFTSIAGNNLNINITGSAMSSNVSNGTVAANGASVTSSIKVSYLDGDGSGSRCTYNVYLERDTTSSYTPSAFYTANKQTYKFEFSVTAAISGTYHGSGTTPSKAETNISDLTFSSNRAVLISNANIRNNNDDTPVTDTWNVTLKFYNLPGDQNSLAAFKWTGRIKVDNVTCGLSY